MSITDNTTTTGSAKPVPGMSDNKRIAILVIGDSLAFIVFATIGYNMHNGMKGFASIPEIIVTAIPFLLAWFAVSPFLGLFGREVAAQPRKMAMRTASAWVIAWPIGVALHFLFEWRVPTVSSAISFGLVTLAVNMLILLLWRWPFAFINTLKQVNK